MGDAELCDDERRCIAFVSRRPLGKRFVTESHASDVVLAAEVVGHAKSAKLSFWRSEHLLVPSHFNVHSSLAKRQ